MSILGQEIYLFVSHCRAGKIYTKQQCIDQAGWACFTQRTFVNVNITCTAPNQTLLVKKAVVFTLQESLQIKKPPNPTKSDEKQLFIVALYTFKFHKNSVH